MYLRRLEVHGFKAFAERQRFDFGPGMTVIVGPNGSGKSNVADAIKWSLGEQSSRQVRARKTEDVIFSGSDLRRPMGMAEVTLFLDNAEGWMPIEYDEVAVTRRAHRSGENEYLINGSNVRLADQVDLFRRAQVGQNSYALMSQGLVDEVLTLRPQDRRGLIEEAADVRRHRHQLVLSERRLAETRDNLGQVRMLIREVEPRIRQLERQSKRAAQYRELAAELSEALKVYYEAELRAEHEALARARANHDQHSTAFSTAQARMNALESRLRELSQAVLNRRAALDQAQARERELSEEGLRLEQAVALTEQRLELLAVRRTELETAIASAEVPDDASEGDIDAQLTAIEARVAGCETALAREREALASADDAARVVLRALAEAEARRARLHAEHEDALRRVVEYRARAERRARAVTEAEAQRVALMERIRRHGAAALEHHRQGRTLAQASSDARRRREAMERRLEEEQRMLGEAREALRAAEAAARQLDERRAMLEQLQESLPTGDGAQALLEAARTDYGPDEDPPVAGIVGVVSRLIRVPSGLEAAIEAALADQLTAVVVEREDDAFTAVDYLRSLGAGTATLLPIDSVEHRYPLNLFNERGVVGIAARLVRTEQRYRPLVETLLGRVIVVENLQVARQMVKRGLGAVVTKDGTLLRPGGAVYGGRTGAAAEQFTLQRELDALPMAIDEARAAIPAALLRVQRADASVADARDAVAEARRVVDEAEERRRAHEIDLAALRRAQAALCGEMRAVRTVLAADEQSGEAADRTARRIEELAAALAEVDASLSELRDRSEAVGAERDAVATRVTEAAGAHAQAEAERRALRAQREERIEARRQARERLALQRTQFAELTRETEDLELGLRDHRARLANNRTARTQAQQEVAPAHASLATLQEEERGLAAERSEAQAALLAAERELLEGESALRRHAERVQQLNEQIADEGLVVHADGTVRPAPPAPPAPPDGDAEAGDLESEEAAAVAIAVEVTGGEHGPMSIRGGAEVDREALRARISELRNSIRALGPVNVDAMDDLGEERERFEFLSTQVGDLEAAEVELRAAIKELRAQIRTRFDMTFEEVNRYFGEYFTRFFGGGHAELRILQEEDEQEPGVDIVAQPPGKRISNLNVLSGGERSMTSVALLFALLAVNPAPVVVLDEVDAALDEANVGRFVETLQELRERTQFIVISHNRRTIEAADLLYGVSMADDSTSQVLSLRLADVPAA